MHTSFDGEEALQVMDQVHIDMLICDIMMPNMDGYELTDAQPRSRNRGDRVHQNQSPKDARDL